MGLGTTADAPRAPVPGRLAAGALLVLLAVAWAFAPALGAQFLSFDDPENFARNHAFRGLGAAHLEWMLSSAHMGHYQPLSWFSLALDWARGGVGQGAELDPAPFHASNLALHGLGALAVGLLALELLRCAGRGSRAWIGALGAALVFGVHPLRVESVVWITERRDVLSAPLFALCLWAWLRRGSVPVSELGARRLAWGAGASLAALALFFGSLSFARPGQLAFGVLGPGGLLAAGAAWALAVFVLARGGGARSYALAALLLLASLSAKAWGIVVPALLLVLDAWPLRRTSDLRSWIRLVLEKAPFWALAVVFAALASWAQSSQVATLKSLEQHGLAARAGQAAYGLCYYAARSLWPADLSPIYELPEHIALGELRFALSLGAVLAVTGALWTLRRRAPWALAAWVAYGVILSPVLGVLQSGPQLVADRYSYLASMPLGLLAGAALETGLARLRPGLRPALIGLAVALLLAAGLATRAQARVWSDSLTLWRHAVEVQPESSLARLSLGSALHLQAGLVTDAGARRELYEQARAQFERGLQLPGAAERAPRLLASLALLEGALAEVEPQLAAQHRARALEYSSRSLELAAELGPVEHELRLNHGVHLFNAGRGDEALAIFEAIVRVRPNLMIARERYGIALLAGGQPRRAIAQFEYVLQLEPGNASAQAWLREARRVAALPR